MESELEPNTTGTLGKTIYNNGVDRIKEAVSVIYVFQYSIEKHILQWSIGFDLDWNNCAEEGWEFKS